MFISLDAEPGGEQNNFFPICFIVSQQVYNKFNSEITALPWTNYMVPGKTDMNLYSGIESFKYMYIITKVMNTGTYTYMYMQIIS